MSLFDGMQSERQFSDAVVEYARLCGWLVHRDPTWRATGADAGYPDLTLVRKGAVIFSELKLDKARSRLSAAQQAWIEALSSDEPTPVTVCVWRPSQWPLIERMLR